MTLSLFRKLPLRKLNSISVLILPIVLFTCIVLLLHGSTEKNNILLTKEKLLDKAVFIYYYQKLYKNTITVDSKNLAGYNGKAVNSDEFYYIIGKKWNQINEISSSKIPLLRRIPDKRSKICFIQKYSIHLPQASIIIIFLDEGLHTLLRTVHTALSRSPPHLVKEVILVNDGNINKDNPIFLNNLKQHLISLDKVKIVKLGKRMGTGQARLEGALLATGEVLVFLDSHVECSYGWLEPLLQSVKDNPNSAIEPYISLINYTNFKIIEEIVTRVRIGYFDWSLNFAHKFPQFQDEKEVLLSAPVMSGVIFAIYKSFFFHIGKYDEGFNDIGGENIELSLRLWMCGEGILINKCSIVHHLFHPRIRTESNNRALAYNNMRTAEVWMDKYKKLYYYSINQKSYSKNVGNLDARIHLRKSLNCKPFSYFLQKFAHEMKVPKTKANIKNYPTIKCISGFDNDKFSKPVLLFKCMNKDENQAMKIEKNGFIIFKNKCLELSYDSHGTTITFKDCHYTANQKWIFLGHLIKHEISQLCLAVKPNYNYVIGIKCNNLDPYQMWTYSFSKSLID